MNQPSAQHNHPAMCILTTRRFFFLLVCLAAWLIAIGFAVAAPNAIESSEYEIKAAFLFKFGAYVEWPAGIFETAKTPLVIGIVGDDPFDGTLDSVVNGHQIEGRPVEVMRGQRIEQIKNEQILFISMSEKARMASIISHLQGKKVLTVAEFDDPNIIIQFVIENDKVRFDINLDQANQVGIKLSSKLLSVARNVKRK
jgi:hypothetical protein